MGSAYMAMTYLLGFGHRSNINSKEMQPYLQAFISAGEYFSSMKAMNKFPNDNWTKNNVQNIANMYKELKSSNQIHAT